MTKPAYRRCPACGDDAGKVFRLDGHYEWDTNAGETLDLDEVLSCTCDLSFAQWDEITRTISRDDFDQDWESAAEAILDARWQ